MGNKKETKEKKGFTKILIPTPIFEKIKEQIKGTGFPSVSSYITYVLQELLTEKDEEKETFNEEDEEKIKKRLRALGYID